MELTQYVLNSIRIQFQFRIQDYVFGDTTLTVMDSGGDNASGLSTLSQTNTSITYNPDSVGIHDCAGEKDCLGEREPVNQDNEITT